MRDAEIWGVVIMTFILAFSGTNLTLEMSKQRQEIRQIQASLAQSAKPSQIKLDLSQPAMQGCLTAFVRYTQGGKVDDYTCQLSGHTVTLYGPDYRAWSGRGQAPVRALGSVELERP